jgi:hypothetical protein
MCCRERDKGGRLVRVLDVRRSASRVILSGRGTEG